MGFLELLQILFVVLKLCNVIDWSWVTVFIPLYIDVALYALIALLGVAYIVIGFISEVTR